MVSDEIVRWETVCSDLERVDFAGLTDSPETSSLIFTVTDGEFLYSFRFEGLVGPYQVLDEAFLAHGTTDTPPGRTAIIKNSSWCQEFNTGPLGVFFSDALNPHGLTHYVIATDSTSLEILSPKPPHTSKQLKATVAATKYPIVVYWSAEDQAYLVEVPDLPGCLADGPTQAEAIANSRVVIQQWLKFAQELGRVIPAPSARLQLAA